jgi:hypothetical protein
MMSRVIERGHPLFVDIEAIETGDPDVPLSAALASLKEVQRALDERLIATTKQHALPCFEPRDGCASCAQCCHESVFLTPLEWLGVVEHMQAHFSPQELETRVRSALALYDAHRKTIDAFMRTPDNGAADHTDLARTLKFTCPLFSKDGCTVYPAREVLGRVFGQSFNDEGGIYGCALSGKYFGGQEVTLVRASAWAKKLRSLPLTGYRQVYPWFFAQTYRG